MYTNQNPHNIRPKHPGFSFWKEQEQTTKKKESSKKVSDHTPSSPETQKHHDMHVKGRIKLSHFEAVKIQLKEFPVEASLTDRLTLYKRLLDTVLTLKAEEKETGLSLLQEAIDKTLTTVSQKDVTLASSFLRDVQETMAKKSDDSSAAIAFNSRIQELSDSYLKRLNDPEKPVRARRVKVPKQVTFPTDEPQLKQVRTIPAHSSGEDISSGKTETEVVSQPAVSSPKPLALTSDQIQEKKKLLETLDTYNPYVEPARTAFSHFVMTDVFMGIEMGIPPAKISVAGLIKNALVIVETIVARENGQPSEKAQKMIEAVRDMTIYAWQNGKQKPDMYQTETSVTSAFHSIFAQQTERLREAALVKEKSQLQDIEKALRDLKTKNDTLLQSQKNGQSDIFFNWMAAPYRSDLKNLDTLIDTIEKSTPSETVQRKLEVLKKGRDKVETNLVTLELQFALELAEKAEKNLGMPNSLEDFIKTIKPKLDAAIEHSGESVQRFKNRGVSAESYAQFEKDIKKLEQLRDQFEIKFIGNELSDAKKLLMQLNNQARPASLQELNNRLKPIIDALEHSETAIKEFNTRGMTLEMDKEVRIGIKSPQSELQRDLLALILKWQPEKFRFDKTLFHLNQTVIVSRQNDQWVAYKLPQDQHYTNPQDKGAGVLGKGSYGKVVKAQKLVTGSADSLEKFMKDAPLPRSESVKTVAIKKMHLLIDAQAVAEKEVTELRNAKGHTGFIQMEGDEIRLQGKRKNYGSGVIEKIYAPLELAEKGDLKSYLRTNPIDLNTPKGLATARQMFIQLLMALKDAHDRGKVLADIKPENILVFEDANGNPVFKISDMGLVHNKDDQSTAGTPAYRPKSLLVGGVMKPENDIFSLGVSFFEVLFGKHPYALSTPAKPYFERFLQTPNLMDIQFAAYQYTLGSIQWPNCPPEIKQLLSNMLSEDPLSRLSAADLLKLALKAELKAEIEDRILKTFNEFNGRFTKTRVSKMAKTLVSDLTAKLLPSVSAFLTKPEQQELLRQLKDQVRETTQKSGCGGKLLQWITVAVDKQVAKALRRP